MSRTYRKQARYYNKYRGEYYHNYKKDRTVKNAPRNLKNEEDCKETLTIWEDVNVNGTWGSAIHRFEVLVGDSECYGLRCPKDVKTRCNRIDRARAKNALHHNPDDVYFTPSFDPWDWD